MPIYTLKKGFYDQPKLLFSSVAPDEIDNPYRFGYFIDKFENANHYVFWFVRLECLYELFLSLPG